MFDQYPNPIRLFSKLRDEWFLDVLEKLEIPLSLFSDVRDSQLVQLLFSIEGSRIKDQRGSTEKKEDIFLFERTTVEGFVPRFTLVKQFRSFLSQNEISIKDFADDFLAHESVKSFLSDHQRSPQEWLNVIPRDKMDLAFLNMADVLLNALLTPMLAASSDEDISRENIKEALGEKSQAFSDMLFNLLNIDIINALENKDWIDGENDKRVITLKSQITDENKEDKPPVFDLTAGDFRGRSNVLYSAIENIIEYFKDPESMPEEKVSEDTELQVDKTPISGSKYLAQALSLEMILYQPYPDKSRIPVVSSHMRDLSSLMSDYPNEFWQLISRIYHNFSSGFTLNSRPFSAFERLFRNQAKEFWSNAKLQFKFDENKHNEMLDKLIAVIWTQFLITRSSINQYTKEGGELFAATLSALENQFWTLERNIFGMNDLHTPMQFWAKFSFLDNLTINNKNDAFRVFNRMKELFENSNIQEEGAQVQLDINLTDLHTIYRRLAFLGIQTGKEDLKSEIESIIDKTEEYLDQLLTTDSKIPERLTEDQERNLIKSLRDSLDNLGAIADDEQHKGHSHAKQPVRRRRRSRY